MTDPAYCEMCGEQFNPATAVAAVELVTGEATMNPGSSAGAPLQVVEGPERWLCPECAPAAFASGRYVPRTA